jgi:hypothetical protein
MGLLCVGLLSAFTAKRASVGSRMTKSTVAENHSQISNAESALE